MRCFHFDDIIYEVLLYYFIFFLIIISLTVENTMTKMKTPINIEMKSDIILK